MSASISMFPVLKDTKARKYRVLVSGFMMTQHSSRENVLRDPVGSIARGMPRVLRADDPCNVSGEDIELVVGPQNRWCSILGEYHYVRAAIKQMHEKHGNEVDLWIHLGVREADFYGCERYAFSQDFSSSWAMTRYYQELDYNNKKVSDYGPNPWSKSVPQGLNTEINVSEVAETACRKFQEQYSVQPWNRSVHDVRSHIRSHTEADPTIHGFAFYESMAQCWVAGRRRHVLFCYVPPISEGYDVESVDRGCQAILAIIGASIASIIAETKPPPKKTAQ